MPPSRRQPESHRRRYHPYERPVFHYHSTTFQADIGQVVAGALMMFPGAAPAPVIPGHAKRVMLIAAFLLIWCLYARAAMQDGFIYLYRIRIF
ncbi:hypothetical protein L208DRAFT_1416076 [Tricholoma matsutake]|nr:hypothetical protein L208DRAFT_1416076 [Tricholoma matsutake 945]